MAAVQDVARVRGGGQERAHDVSRLRDRVSAPVSGPVPSDARARAPCRREGRVPPESFRKSSHTQVPRLPLS